MSKQLDDYLNEVGHHLRPLPPHIRNDEISEISAHLQQLIEECKTMGHDEDESTTLAIERFGSARKVGIHLRDVWEGNHHLLIVLIGWLVWQKILAVSGLWSLFSLYFQPEWLITVHFSDGWRRFSPIGEFLIPFLLSTAFGLWGGRRVVYVYALYALAYVCSIMIFPTYSLRFSLHNILDLAPLGVPTLGGWFGAALNRSRRFSRASETARC